MFLTNHSSAFLLHDVRVVKNVACLSSLLRGCHLIIGMSNISSASVTSVLSKTNCNKKVFQSTSNNSAIFKIVPDIFYFKQR